MQTSPHGSPQRESPLGPHHLNDRTAAWGIRGGGGGVAMQPKPPLNPKPLQGSLERAHIHPLQLFHEAVSLSVSCCIFQDMHLPAPCGCNSHLHLLLHLCTWQVAWGGGVYTLHRVACFEEPNHSSIMHAEETRFQG